MAIAYAAAPRFEMGRVVRRTFSVIGDNITTFAMLSLIPAVSVAAMGWAGSQFENGAWEPTLPDVNTLALIGVGFVLYLLASVFFQGAVVHGAVASLNGRRASIPDCTATGLRYAVPLLCVGLLMMLGMVVGFVLLIVPMIMFAVMWCVVAPACVVERTGVFGAFRRSRDLTRGHRWPIFGLFLAFGFLMVIISMVFGAVAGVSMVAAQSEGAASGMSIVAMGSSVISSMISAILGSTFAAALYYELRQIKEGIGPEALASVFD